MTLELSPISLFMKFSDFSFYVVIGRGVFTSIGNYDIDKFLLKTHCELNLEHYNTDMPPVKGHC